jgi:hypothetical protein
MRLVNRTAEPKLRVAITSRIAALFRCEQSEISVLANSLPADASTEKSARTSSRLLLVCAASGYVLWMLWGLRFPC